MIPVAIVGAGVMGHGLALVFALGGHPVRITDRRPEARERVAALMASALETLVAAGEVDASWTADRLQRAVQVEATLAEAVAGAGLVIEAITEDREAKRGLFEELDVLLTEDAILASNTSYLDIFPLVPPRRRRRTLVVHWYTPPYVIDLVDIVPGPETDPEVVTRVHDVVRALGQVPVVLRSFVPGYIANRIQSAITLEVLQLLDDGIATPREIDDAIVHGLSLRLAVLGHLAKADFSGLDLMRRSLANRTYAPPPPRGRSDILDALCAAGRTGVMSGGGFFDWGGRSAEDLFSERDRRLLALKRALREIGRMEGSQPPGG